MKTNLLPEPTGSTYQAEREYEHEHMNPGAPTEEEWEAVLQAAAEAKR
jgi:hypothetical protein